jgi:Ca2+-binding EF-hand superfamily protein/ribosome maturation factor RimP
MTRRTLQIALALAAGLFCATTRQSVDAAGGGPAVRARKPQVQLKIGGKYTVLMKDGKVYSGALVKFDAKSITLKVKTKTALRNVTVQRKDIEEIRKAPAKAAAAGKPAIDLKVGDRYFVTETTGRVLIGILSKMDAKTITLKGAGGRTFVIKRSNIDEIRKVPKTTADVQKRLEALKKQQEALRQQLEARRRALLLRQRGRSQNSSADRDEADPKDPQETVVLLSPRGPVIVEFEIYADGKPFRMHREAIVDELMSLVKSKDGNLTWEKALADPRFSFGRYAYVSRGGSSRTALIRQFDLNGDGLVQRAEVRRYISRLGYGGAFNVRPSYSYLTQPDVKSVLDTNKDGVIDAGELKAAYERLKSRDADDNDLLTANELGGGQRRQYGVVFGRSSGGGMRLPTTPRTVFQLGPSASLTSLYNELVKHYGDDQKLVRAAAFRLDPKLFKTLDLNKNGILESGEVIGFHLAKPAVKLEIRIGKDGKRSAGVVVKSLAKGLRVEGADGKSSNEHLSISLPGWKLRIHAAAGAVRTVDYTRTAESYIARYDTNKNGYLEIKELKALGAAGRYPLQQFKMWDANGDGKVYADEIKKAFDRALAPQMSQVTLTEQSQGPSLFAALDETGDGRLSLREMRNAGQRLLSLDRNRNGRIDPDEMPSEVSLSFSRGYGGNVGYGQVYYGGRPRTSAPVRGPRWFFHMDKNGDGDVSLREFLGTKEQFQKLDANGDGLIELKEAEAAGKTSK